MTAIDLSSDIGLIALALLTLTVLLGLVPAAKYNPVRAWPHRRVNTVGIHNWSAYGALAASLAHPFVLLLSSTAHFTLLDVLVPVNAPKQPLVNCLGAGALYLLVLLVVTSYLWRHRTAIGRRAWKRIHFAAYALFPLAAVHSLLTDPTLQDHPVDWLDAEKVFGELCIVLVVAGVALRVRHRYRRPGPARIVSR